MKQVIMSIFTRTPLHVGAGNSVGVVDAPVMRERHTSIPIIPGSSLKGVFSDFWNDANYDRNQEGNNLFGKADDKNDNSAEKATAGQLLIGEARVLAFPVRSAKSIFAWVTCPLALQRYAREANNNVLADALKKLPSLKDLDCLADDYVTENKKVLLEEYCLTSKGNCQQICTELAKMLPQDAVWETVNQRLVVISDDMFAFFVANTCEVVTRIGIDDKTGVVKKGALFYQEQVPSETMFYSLICDSGLKKDIDVLSLFKNKIITADDGPKGTVQIGGDETIGLGFCSVNFI